MNNTIEVPYAAPVYGEEEIGAVIEVLKNPKKIVAGPAVGEFENEIAKLFGKKFGVMVNSGSSANLLALETLNIPKGSEVITPVLTFSTTLAPIIQKQLTPVFVDVCPGAYVIDINDVERLITPRTRALMIPSLLGNLPDLEKLQKIAQNHTLHFVEDSCDTLGGKFKSMSTGFYSEISTTSFYASHIITAAGGGGMVCFHDENQAARAKVMSNWGRESTKFGYHEKSEDMQKRFSETIDGEVYDAKFIFSELGYNFQATELMGAFGFAQLKRLTSFAEKRKKNFEELLSFFKAYSDLFILPQIHHEALVNWLAFPLTIKQGASFTREQITRHLEEHNIQTRPIFTGNVLRQPAFKHLNKEYNNNKGRYPVADNIMRNGFMIGCHHGLEEKHMTYIKKTFTIFLKNHV